MNIIRALTKAVNKYGVHLAGCSFWKYPPKPMPKCDCGLHEAQKGEPIDEGR